MVQLTELCFLITGRVVPAAGTMALSLRNGGSQSPDRWLKVSRNTHKSIKNIENTKIYGLIKAEESSEVFSKSGLEKNITGIKIITNVPVGERIREYDCIFVPIELFPGDKCVAWEERNFSNVGIQISQAKEILTSISKMFGIEYRLYRDKNNYWTSINNRYIENRKDILKKLKEYSVIDCTNINKMSDKLLNLRLKLFETMSDAADKALKNNK